MFTGEFREYQEDIIEELLEQLKEHCTTTMSLPPGWGKTMASMFLSWRLGLRSIVIIPLDKVLDGWIATCKKFLPDFIVWVVGRGPCPDNVDIILCMDRRFKNISKEIIPTIGTLIADEVHMLCSIQE
jgi:superfamily II DNA or RNA helicase